MRRKFKERLSSSEFLKEDELNKKLRSGNSFKIRQKFKRHDEENSNISNEKNRSFKHFTPLIVSSAPEYLARNLLQLGSPIMFIPKPRAGTGTENLPDRNEFTTLQNHYGNHLQDQGQNQNLAESKVPEVEFFGTFQTLSSINGQILKPMCKTPPSVTIGDTETSTSVSKTSLKPSPSSSISSGRQKKFHRHFNQVSTDEKILNYYSCALVGDILPQGHLYITPNYFAFYSNIFGYVTKVLIPTISVIKITKVKTARIIPNAVAVATEEERYVFASLLLRETTYKLMMEVWEKAMESRSVAEISSLVIKEDEPVISDSLQVDETETKTEEDDSSISESGAEITPRPPTISTDTDGHSPSIPNLQRLEEEPLVKPETSENSMKFSLRSMMGEGINSNIIIAILVALLAALYVSAALMMFRIDKLHSAYVNYPLATPEFTQDRLLQDLNINLDQIIKVRQSLQTLSQQIISMSHDRETATVGSLEPNESPS